MAGLAAMVGGQIVGGAINTGLQYAANKSLMNLQLQNQESLSNFNLNQFKQSGLPLEMYYANMSSGSFSMPHESQNLGGQNFQTNMFPTALKEGGSVYVGNFYGNQQQTPGTISSAESRPGLGTGGYASNMTSQQAADATGKPPTTFPSSMNNVFRSAGFQQPSTVNTESVNGQMIGSRNVSSTMSQQAVNSLGNLPTNSSSGTEMWQMGKTSMNTTPDLGTSESVQSDANFQLSPATSDPLTETTVE